MSKKQKEPDFIQRKIQKMITVTDDWYPCFDGNQVRVSLSLLYFKEYYLVLSVWGNDDTGVEMRYSAKNKEDGEAKFEEWKQFYDAIPDTGTNMDWFYSRGFIRA